LEHTLEKKLEHRPDQDSLEQRNILKDTDVAPSLAAKKAELEKEQLADSLSKKVAERPKEDALKEKGVL